MRVEFSFDCDLDTRVRVAEESLRRGQRVELHFRFRRGREMAHIELGMNVVRQAIFRLTTVGRVHGEPKLIGRNIRAALLPMR